MNNELRKNLEGYTDPTAAATLTKPEAGDVWTYNGGACLVIKNHGKLSTILPLYDQERHPNNVEIMTKKGPMYADQRLITYGLHVKMPRYIDTVSVEDFRRVIEAVEDAVGLSLLASAEAEAQDLQNRVLLQLQEENRELRERLDVAEGEAIDNTQDADRLAEQLTAAREQLKTLEGLQNLKEAELAAARNGGHKARNQLELLREMYNDLLAHVVGGVW